MPKLILCKMMRYALSIISRKKSMPKNVIILAGPNGVGKTSFANQYLDIYNYQYLSADAIAEKLTHQSFNGIRVSTSYPSLQSSGL
ncbi:MAG: hypothetical protein VSS75_025195 [Candidatus Parabeggiatoa sp.]|nr:hypothetical protein [Candidatus Parabeggiatoa sp.]